MGGAAVSKALRTPETGQNQQASILYLINSLRFKGPLANSEAGSAWHATTCVAHGVKVRSAHKNSEIQVERRVPSFSLGSA